MGRLAVKVVPGSSRDRIVGRLGAALKIKVAAPAEKGKANAAVIELLAERLGVGTEAITIESGHTSPAKILVIDGLDDEAIAALLAEEA